jgi:hypothetical protein
MNTKGLWKRTRRILKDFGTKSVPVFGYRPQLIYHTPDDRTKIFIHLSCSINLLLIASH